ncbi:unnamed protein product [Mytilus edulis]|uniref:DZIP3-like HEPN domain-containing protein n=1 Tax=Mytilus edulis TaxID=6550 RepID=A0A8S3UKM7_MYTED|nr:unnamed protein product [Mytilus edulis]
MSLPGEESNFLRFYFLNLKVASKAVRVYFDSVHPPGGLAGELSSISTTLKRLRFITKQQLKYIIPKSWNLPPLESAPVTGWDDLPHSSDKSTGADLARFKWYRNKLAHHEDGKLSHTDYNQYWGDLEGAIGRLGGPSMLKESQSAQHVVLDKSLKEMLNMIRNNEKDIQDLHVSQEKHTIMINDLQTTIDNQKTIKEQHENKIQELNDSIQKGESQTQTVTSELSAYKGSIQKCTEEIEHCKKEIDKAELLIKGIQENLMDKQNLIKIIHCYSD